MRVTEKMRFAAPHADIERLRARQSRLQEELSSGRRINKPSDDALGAEKATRLESQHRRLQQYQRNLRVADSVLQHADGVLGEATSAMQRIKELAIQSASSAISDQDALTIADEMEHLRDHLFSLANTRVAGRYVFGGRRVDAPPYDALAGFRGDPGGAVEIEIGEQRRVTITPQGGAAFGDGTADTVDVFAAIAELELSIRTRDEAGTQDGIETLEAALEQVVDVRAAGGTKLTRIEAGRAVNDLLLEKVPADLAEVRDTDFTAAVTELSLLDTALQATLSVAAQRTQAATLLDFLR